MNTTTRAAAIKELKTELEMRRRVWRRIPSQKDEFIDDKQQHRYEVLENVLIVIETMTDRDFIAIQARAAEIEKSLGEQTSLF